jgi:hypothetical protein
VSRVGTVLGQPTYAELADLCAVQRFNLAQIAEAKSACATWAAKDPTGYGAWAASVYDASAALSSVLTDAEAEVNIVPEGLRSVTPVLSPLGTDNNWKRVLAAAQPFHALVTTYAQKSGCAWPAGIPPQPTAPDFDLKVYQWTGKVLDSIQFGGSALLILGLAFLLFGQGGKR